MTNFSVKRANITKAKIQIWIKTRLMLLRVGCSAASVSAHTCIYGSAVEQRGRMQMSNTNQSRSHGMEQEQLFKKKKINKKKGENTH